MSSKRKEGGKNLSHSTGLHTPRSQDALKAKGKKPRQQNQLWASDEIQLPIRTQDLQRSSDFAFTLSNKL